MFARNFKNARAAEPELDVNSLAFLGIPTPPDAARRTLMACAFRAPPLNHGTVFASAKHVMVLDATKRRLRASGIL